MNDDWKILTIGDLGRVVTGKTPSTKQLQLYGDRYPFITPTDIDKLRYCEPVRHLSEKGRESQRNLLLPPKSVCVTCIASVGKMCMTDKPSFTNQQINSVVVDERWFNPFFVYYLILNRVEHLKAIAGGAATPIVNKTNFSRIEVRVPPLRVQNRIASVLSAYDELIENSESRIFILESKARALYREWFVNFRFPDYQHSLAGGTSSGVPKDWRMRPLFDLAKVAYGKNLPKKELSVDGSYPVYGAAKIIGRYTDFTREHRTIICGCRGTVGEMRITQPFSFVTNNSFTFDPLQSEGYFWLFHALMDRGFLDVIGGSAQPQITLDSISSVELIEPPLELRSHFQRLVLPLFQQIWNLEAKVSNLRRTRDLLLPRLLSGQVSLDTQPEEAVV